MKVKRKYQSKKRMDISSITMEERLKILANVIVDRIMENQQKNGVKKGGDNG